MQAEICLDEAEFDIFIALADTAIGPLDAFHLSGLSVADVREALPLLPEDLRKAIIMQLGDVFRSPTVGAVLTVGSKLRAPLQDDTIVELVRLAKEGDARALEDICKAYAGHLHRMARVRMGPRLRRLYDESDLVAETFHRVLLRIPSLVVGSNAEFLNWLSHILSRTVRDLDESAVRRGSSVTEALVLDPIDSGESGRDPLQRLMEEESRAIYDECVAALAEPERELILLRDYVGKSWDDIADEIKLGKTAVAEAYRHAHSRLHAKLEERLRGT